MRTKRAEISVGSALPLEKRSWWLNEALAREQGAEWAAPLSLRGKIASDVCIIGGGYTGLWTALALKEIEPTLDVVLLDADLCGTGASGRNGGFVLSWWVKFGTLAKLTTSEEAIRLATASAEAVDDIGQFCARNGIDAHYRRDGWLRAATSEAQIGAWTGLLRALDKAGVAPFESLSAAEVAERAGTPTHLAGIFEPSAATVQPALLARGLRRVAVERGIRVFERSPVLRIQHKHPTKVTTNEGEVMAGTVVLATNAWTGTLARELRRAAVVVSSDIVVTAPIPKRLKEIGWSSGLAISDSRFLINYYRTTLDGRIAFGTGGGRLAFGGRVGNHFHGPSERREAVHNSLVRLYPALADVSVVSSWTGPVDRSVSGLPFFGALSRRRNVLFGLGFSGNGVGPSVVAGRILASLVLERDDEWSRCALVRQTPEKFPPEPVRYLGGRIVKAAVARKERAEDAGRRPSALTLRVASLAPGAGPVPAVTDTAKLRSTSVNHQDSKGSDGTTPASSLGGQPPDQPRS